MGNKKEDNNPKKFVLSSYWIYGLAIFIIIAMNVVTLLNGKTASLTEYKFKDIALKGHVEKVDVINEKIAKVYLKKEHLDKYPDFKENKFNKNIMKSYFRAFG